MVALLSVLWDIVDSVCRHKKFFGSKIPLTELALLGLLPTQSPMA